MTKREGKLKVLLVDDDVHILEALRVIVLTMEFDVVGEAHDGLEAVALFRQHQPDLTLMDVVMPGMDGIAALK